MDVQHAHRPVVVGVDGSPSALRAVAWAATEAARRGVGLRVVTAFAWTADHVVGHPGLGERYRNQMLAVARREVAAAAELANKTEPDLDVTTQVEIAAPIGALGSEARRAQLVVLGDRGLGGLAGLLLGSVAVALAADAACPVVIVRGDRAGDEGAVVVGIDGSPVSEAALSFAFDAAAARGAELVAVHSWWPTRIDDALGPMMDWDAVAVEESAVLAERLAGWGQRYPDVAVRRLVVRDAPARALVEASKSAQLVVVGSRGRGNATGLMLGSVSHGVLHRAHCPVGIVRPETVS
jgi:nucleotide-binding universal stress UspA family protein